MQLFQFGVPALALLSASSVLGACSSDDPGLLSKYNAEA